MVDASSCDIVPKGEIVSISMDKLDSAVDIFYGQAMSLIKLRKKGATKVSLLPRGVFRCIIERQLPKLFLLWRYSDPYVQIQGYQQN